MGGSSVDRWRRRGGEPSRLGASRVSRATRAEAARAEASASRAGPDGSLVGGGAAGEAGGLGVGEAVGVRGGGDERVVEGCEGRLEVGLGERGEVWRALTPTVGIGRVWVASLETVAGSEELG